MNHVRTVLLEHTRRDGRHFDWLIEDPKHPTGPLIAFRAGVGWPVWARLGVVDLVALPPHRRRYLSYQGPISGGRGVVRRVGIGVALVERWTPTHAVLALRPLSPRTGELGPVALQRLGPSRWRVALPTAPPPRPALGLH